MTDKDKYDDIVREWAEARKRRQQRADNILVLITGACLLATLLMFLWMNGA